MSLPPIENFRVRTDAFIVVQLGGSSVEYYCEIFPTRLDALVRIDEIRAADHDALGPFECDGAILKHHAGLIPVLNAICSAVSERRTAELSALLALALEKPNERPKHDE